MQGIISKIRTTTKWRVKVVGVLDGDTLDCYEGEGKKHRIRLAEIDAPEKSQAYGQKAKKMLSVFNLLVR